MTGKINHATKTLPCAKQGKLYACDPLALEFCLMPVIFIRDIHHGAKKYPMEAKIQKAR